MDGTSLGSCDMSSFGIGGVEHSTSATRLLVDQIKNTLRSDWLLNYFYCTESSTEVMQI
jgi:hypothetical protein